MMPPLLTPGDQPRSFSVCCDPLAYNPSRVQARSSGDCAGAAAKATYDQALFVPYGRKCSIPLAVRTIMAHLGFLDMQSKVSAWSGDRSNTYGNGGVDAGRMAGSSARSGLADC